MKTGRIAVVVAFAAFAAAGCCRCPAALAQSPVENTSYVADDGTRALRHSVIVPGAPAAVWAAFTTTDGYRSWAAPVAAVDFRLGGMFETSYAADGRLGAPGNIRNEIVAVLPQRMFALRNRQAPPDVPFDAAIFQALNTVVQFDDVGGGFTRVTVTMPGYRRDEAHDRIYKFFDWGNAATLAALRERFAKGPKDWSKPAA